MSKRQATHKGECQICGRTQKLPTGVLSLHGYTVNWGFFNGVCTGAGFLPFEQDNSQIEGAIEAVTAQRDAMVKRAAEIRADTEPETAKATYYVPYQKARNGKGGYASVTVQTSDVHLGTKGLRSGDWVATVADNGHEYDALVAPRSVAQTPVEAAYYSNQAIAKEVDSNVEQATAYIAWQTRRNRDWAPRELRPISA